MHYDETELAEIRDDYRRILSAAIPQIPDLRAAIVEGRIEGRSYYGKCACLIGTIANAVGANPYSLDGITPNANRPAEDFFWSIRKGDTPETSEYSALALLWLDEFVAEQAAK